MGKGGAVLGIIGIILGAGAIGFAFIVWNTQNSIKSDLAAEDIWYQYDEDIFSGIPTGMNVAIPNMSIIFELKTTMSIHILFTCAAITYPTAFTYTDMFFRFTVDGVLIQNPRARVGSYNEGSSNDFYSVALQHFIQDFPAGTHNITVMVWSEHGANFIRQCALSIQSFVN